METILNKAKAYDEVVNKLRRFMEQGVNPLITRADVQDFFPELKESEGERVLKIIKETLKSYNSGVIFGSLSAKDYADCLAWIERQGEQKENATRDKIAKYLTDLILDQSQRGFPMIYYEGRVEEEVDFIINIAKEELKKEKQSEHQKPAHKEHKPAEWSEKDKTMAFTLMRDIEQISFISKEGKRERIQWLNNLPGNISPQPHQQWKPSGEQIEALRYFITSYLPRYNASTSGWIEFENLQSLYNDLKKLKEE